jgi:CRP/FNR family cyclic AMP-dependent transcriptional regulator
MIWKNGSLPNNSSREPGREMSRNDSSKIKLLQSTALFAGLPENELAELASSARFTALDENQTLFIKGDPGRQLFIVARGVIRISSNSSDGKETTLNLLRAGQMFGEIALLDEQERTANATAHEASELLVVERHDLMDFLDHHPHAMRRMLVAVCSRLRWVAEALEDAHFLDLPHRLAKRILLLSQLFGHPTANGATRIALQLSQQDLAELLVVTRESVNRQLKHWEAEGIMTLKGGYLVVMDLAQLERITAR